MTGIGEKRDAQTSTDSWLADIANTSRRTLACLAGSDCPVLLVGEHGVGKRTVAMEIHARSRRAHASFTAFTCRDLDPQDLRSLFHDPGTVYLAEAASLSPSLQKLLIEEYFSSADALKCRLLFGSCREWVEDVKALRIREDFYYLASVVTLRIAPLRLRKPELLIIADALLCQYAQQFDRPKPALSDETIQFLMDHTWPGNLPELQTAIKTFVAIGDQSISLAALKAVAPMVRINEHTANLSLKQATRQASFEVERQLISQVLRATGGNRKRAARELGISYKALLYKIKQIGLADPSAIHRFGVAI
jgi:two-component system response regulator AtoC